MQDSPLDPWGPPGQLWATAAGRSGRFSRTLRRFSETCLQTGEQDISVTRYSRGRRKVNRNYRFMLHFARPNPVSGFPGLAVVDSAFRQPHPLGHRADRNPPPLPHAQSREILGCQTELSPGAPAWQPTATHASVSLGLDHTLAVRHFTEVSPYCFMTVGGKIQALIPVVGSGLDGVRRRGNGVPRQPTLRWRTLDGRRQPCSEPRARARGSRLRPRCKVQGDCA